MWACKPYIEEYYIYQNINIKKYNQNDLVIIGDFNSNKIWDNTHKNRDHSAVVRELQNMNIRSIYHDFFNEEQGEECIKTFFLYRHLDKGYHIDHCFSNITSIKKYEVLSSDHWLEFSDHMPILLEI